MIQLEDNSLSFAFPEIPRQLESLLEQHIQKIRPVDDFAVPAEWLKRGGVMMPMPFIWHCGGRMLAGFTTRWIRSSSRRTDGTRMPCSCGSPRRIRPHG
jgi:hypothetical protein